MHNNWIGITVVTQLVRVTCAVQELGRLTEYTFDPKTGAATARRLTEVTADFPVVNPYRVGALGLKVLCSAVQGYIRDGWIGMQRRGLRGTKQGRWQEGRAGVSYVVAKSAVLSQRASGCLCACLKAGEGRATH